MTLNTPQFTQGAAIADNDPSETVVLAIPPPPEQPQENASGISQTTEHLLIAAGSIGRHQSPLVTFRILTGNRRDHHHCDDRTGPLHDAETRPLFLGLDQPEQTTDASRSTTSSKI
jgi:hypothetical protein